LKNCGDGPHHSLEIGDLCEFHGQNGGNNHETGGFAAKTLWFKKRKQA
jgi:hypothetical protein